MGKPRQRAVDIPGLQHQSGRCCSRASGRTSKQTMAKREQPTASGAPFEMNLANLSHGGNNSRTVDRVRRNHRSEVSLSRIYPMFGLGLTRLQPVLPPSHLKSAMNLRRRISAPKVRRQHLIGLNESFNRGYHLRLIIRSAQPMSAPGCPNRVTKVERHAVPAPAHFRFWTEPERRGHRDCRRQAGCVATYLLGNSRVGPSFAQRNNRPSLMPSRSGGYDDATPHKKGCPRPRTHSACDGGSGMRIALLPVHVGSSIAALTSRGFFASES